MSITISQLADELRVSRETIRQQTKKLPPEMVIYGARRTIIISDEAADIIRQALAGGNANIAGDCQCLQDDVGSENAEKSANSKNDLQCNTCKLLASTNKTLEVLEVNLQDLREQLQVKNAELEAKNQQISDLMQALQNEQILHGKVLQLEPPKRKWYEVFTRKKERDS